MKILTKALITTILLTSTLTAEDTLTKINFEQDEDGNVNPSFFFPVYWDDDYKYYSGAGYGISTSKEIGTVSNFSDSKSVLISKTATTNLNWITRKVGHYSIGLQTNIIKTDNDEFGYIHDAANVFGNGTDYWIAFDNSIELETIQTGIYADYTKIYDNLGLRLSTNISPSTTINVSQTTLFKPLVTDVGSSSSTTSQDLAYQFKLEAVYDTHSFVDIGFFYDYSFTPKKYDIDQLAYVNSNYVFEKATINTEEVTTKYLVKLYINKKVLGGLNPIIGLGNKNTQSKNKDTGKVTTDDNRIVSLGFERKF